MIEQEDSLTIATRPRPCAARKLSWPVLLRFRQEDEFKSVAVRI